MSRTMEEGRLPVRWRAALMTLHQSMGLRVYITSHEKGKLEDSNCTGAGMKTVARTLPGAKDERREAMNLMEPLVLWRLGEYCSWSAYRYSTCQVLRSPRAGVERVL